jgi:hypothetical protein
MWLLQKTSLGGAVPGQYNQPFRFQQFETWKLIYDWLRQAAIRNIPASELVSRLHQFLPSSNTIHLAPGIGKWRLAVVAIRLVSQRTAYCLLPTAYCLLPIAYCLIKANTMAAEPRVFLGNTKLKHFSNRKKLAQRQVCSGETGLFTTFSLHSLLKFLF